MKKIWIWIVIIVALLLIVFISTQMKRETQDIKIGAILPLTGPAAQFGEWKKQGIDIAVNEINGAGGIKGKQLIILYEDSQGDPKLGLSALQKLTSFSGTKIVFSDLTGVTLAILQKTKRDILVITSAVHPEVTSGKYLAIRNYVTPNQEAHKMALYAKTNLSLQRIAVLYLNDDAMRSYNQEFVETYNSLGGETYSEAYNSGDNDFRSQLAKIKQWNPDGLYIIGWKEVGSILAQAKELGIKAQILGPISFDSPMMLSLAGNAANGAIFTVPKISGPYNTTKTIEFIEKYKQIYGVEPEAITIIWYDTIHALAYGISQNGNDPEAVFEVLTQGKEFSGAMGDFNFDKIGNIHMAIGFKVIHDGKFEWLEN